MVRIADLICSERMARDLEPCRAASFPETAPSAQLTGRWRTIQSDRFRRRCRLADTTGVQECDLQSRNLPQDRLRGAAQEVSQPPAKPVSCAGPAAKGRRCKRRGHGDFRHGTCGMALMARCIAQMSRAGPQGCPSAPHAPPRQPVTGPVPHLGAVCLVHRRARRLDLDHENSRRRERMAPAGHLMRGRGRRGAPKGFRTASLSCAHTHRIYE